MTEATKEPMPPRSGGFETSAPAEKGGCSESRGADAGDAATASTRSTTEIADMAKLNTRLSLPLDKARKRKRKKNAVALFSNDDEDDEKKHRVGLLDLNLDERRPVEATLDSQPAERAGDVADGAGAAGGQGRPFAPDDLGEPNQLVAAGSGGHGGSNEGGGVASDKIPAHDSEGRVSVDDRLSAVSSEGQGHQEQGAERHVAMETLQSRPHNQEQPPRDDRDSSDVQPSLLFFSQIRHSPQPVSHSEETDADEGTVGLQSGQAADSMMMVDSTEVNTGAKKINMDLDHATKISNMSAINVRNVAMSNQTPSGIHSTKREQISGEANAKQDTGEASECQLCKCEEITDYPLMGRYNTQGTAGKDDSQALSRCHAAKNDEVTTDALINANITQDIGGTDESQTSSIGRIGESETADHSLQKSNITQDMGRMEETQLSSNGHVGESEETTTLSFVNANVPQGIGATDESQGVTTCSTMRTKSEMAASFKSTGSTTANHQQQAPQHKTQQQHQPPGWRVKLYRLNKDGTWDDCGTGRIQFYFAKANQTQTVQQHHQHLQQQEQLHSNHAAVTTGQKKAKHDSKTHPEHASSEHAPPQKHLTPNFQSLHQAAFRELGEPMLCMRAEIPPQPELSSQQPHGEENTNSNTGNKVLLRTRVLLNNAYQCQGGNIITWCEPFHVQGGGQQQQQQQHSPGRGPPLSQQIGVDLALSFQDNAGFKDIWQHILDVQLRAKELSHSWTRACHGNVPTSSVSSASSTSTPQVNNIRQAGHFNDSQIPFQHHNHHPLSPEKNHNLYAHQPLSPNSPDHDALEDRQLSMVTLPKHPPLWSGHHAQSHHSSTVQHQQRQQHLGQKHCDGEKENEYHCRETNDGTATSPAWASHGADGERDSYSSNNSNNSSVGQDGDASAIGRVPSPLSLYNENHSSGNSRIDFDTTISPSQLPASPKWSDLDEIIDAIAGGQMHQREDMLIFLSQSDCAYIKSLLGLFHSAPEDQLDRGELATLAVCIKSILLLNDPEIIEYVTTDEEVFESVCGVLEYNPELREKADYRMFIREHARFRTVVKMEDDDLMSHIHRLFRVNYLKDFILRPTMDESSLSTLVSLAQFTQSDIIKGVMRLIPQESEPSIPIENYFLKILHMLGIEIKAIREKRWNDAELAPAVNSPMVDVALKSSESLSNSNSYLSTVWHQHVAPQDSSLQSRYVRRKGCLNFLKELFNMARSSLQQQEKDEFISSCVKASVKLKMGSAEMPSPDGSSENTLHINPPLVVSLLLLLGTILSDQDSDINEKSAALEILSVITLHDPSFVRRHCLNSSNVRSSGKLSNLRPEPDEQRQIIFLCPPDDLLQSLLFLMSTESDAGLLLQTSEIIRILLDTEILGEHVTLDANGFLSEENDLGPSGHGINGQSWNAFHESGAGGLESSDQNNFLAMFYDRYIQWLFSPFLYKVLVPKAVLPLDASSEVIVQVQQTFRQNSSDFNTAFRCVPPCAIRSTFTLEILSFCVRAHVYRMKLYVLRTRLLSTTLKILSHKSSSLSAYNDRCLKLASLKLLRSVLSVKDEFYHRHIVQCNLFAPVFELFRSIPVGNNLVSSAILEMCDFIRTENIKSLIEYIVTRHMSPQTPNKTKSLEDIANPHVDTFKQLRQKYLENSLPAGSSLIEVDGELVNQTATGDLHDNVNGVRPILNKKALDDQRKFRESDEEESYFNDDSIDSAAVLSQKTLPAGGVMPLIENVTSLQS